jgi:hypothetical protein
MEVPIMMQLKHWQDPVNGLVGVAVALSPWILGFQDNMPAMVNALAVGMALLATALGAIFVPRAWEEWTEVGLGLWLIAAPWVLGFFDVPAARLSALGGGLLIVVLALWTLATDKDYRASWDRTVQH